MRPPRHQVVVATSQMALLISTLSATIAYLIAGSIIFSYGGVLAGITLVATIIGQVSINWAVRKTGRPSILILMLALMVCGATALGAYVAVTAILRAAALGPSGFAAHSVCTASAGRA